MKYRRIPGEPIEAGQWGRDIRIANRHPGIFFEEGPIGWHVVTIHGQKTKIVDGDWILPESDGIHFYPCKPEVFAKTYELAERGPMTWDGKPTTLENMDAEMGYTRGPRDNDADGQIANGLTPDQIFDIKNKVRAPRTISHQIANNYQIAGEWSHYRLIDEISHVIEDAREIGAKRAAVGYEARIAELEAKLQAEGDHTAAANANIDRLNTEIERVTRRQQGDLVKEKNPYARDVADWCQRSMDSARTGGNLDTRPFVQNVELIIKALRQYAEG